MPRRPKQTLSATFLDRVKTDKVQQDFADDKTPGLAVRVSVTGRKTWLVAYRVNGRNRRMKLGTYPSLTLAKAREEARDTFAKVARGEDPAQDRKDGRKGRNTFAEMAAEVVSKEMDVRKAHGGLRESTYTEWKRILDNELLPVWKDRPVSEISRRDVRDLTERIGERAPAMAGSVLSFVKWLFNKGLDRDFPTLEGNPAARLKLPWKEGVRDRYLTAKEIRKVWKATEPETPGTRGLFRIALLTGQRMGSVAAMRWDGIEKNGDGAALWTIPEEHFKGKRPHLVPLSPEALQVLEGLREIAGSPEWVFPSRPGTETPHMVAWNRSLDRLRERTDLPVWTAHDFRTTFRTHAVRAREDDGLGIPGPIADAVLGHKESTLGFQRYTGDQDRYLLHEKREALLAWGTFVRAAIEKDGEDD